MTWDNKIEENIDNTSSDKSKIRDNLTAESNDSSVSKRGT